MQATDITISGQVPPGMRDRYTVRVKEATFGDSAKGHAMITLKCEIVHPETKVYDGKTYALDTIPLTYYLMTNIVDTDTKETDIEKTKKALGNIWSLLERLQMDPRDFDPANPDLKPFEGLVFDAIISSEEDKPQKQGANGKWEPILDAEGKPLVKGWKIAAQVNDILCRSTLKTNEAF